MKAWKHKKVCSSSASRSTNRSEKAEKNPRSGIPQSEIEIGLINLRAAKLLPTTNSED